MAGLQTSENYGVRLVVDLVASLVIFAVVYFFFCREKREGDLNGVMSWREGFWSAAIMTLMFIPLSTLAVYTFAEWINPDFVRIHAERSSGGSFEKDPVSIFLNQHAWSALIGGLLFSLIFPIFTRRAPR